ncbi:unnamed protein product, partial [Prorocentrum cordatum]
AKALACATVNVRKLELETGLHRRSGSELCAMASAWGHLTPQEELDFKCWNTAGNIARHKRWSATSRSLPSPPPVNRVAWADTYDTDFPAWVPAAAADTIGENRPAASSFEPRVGPTEPGTRSRLPGSSCRCGSNPALPSEAALDSIFHTFEKRTLDKLDEKLLAGFELLSVSNAKQLPTLFATSVKPVMELHMQFTQVELLHGVRQMKLTVASVPFAEQVTKHAEWLKLIEVDTEEVQQHIDSIEKRVQFLQDHEQYPDNRDGSPHCDRYFDTLLTHVKRDDCCNDFMKILNSLPESHSGGWRSIDCQPPAPGIHGTAVTDSPNPLTQSETFDQAADAEATQSETDELLTPSETYELQQHIAHELEPDEIEFNSELELVEPTNKVDCRDDFTKFLDSIDLCMPQPELKAAQSEFDELLRPSETNELQQQIAHVLAHDELELDELQLPPARDELDEFDEHALQSEFGQLFSPGELDELKLRFESKELLRPLHFFIA